MIVKKRDENEIFTVMDYLSGKVKFGVTKNSLQAHLADRGLTPTRHTQTVTRTRYGYVTPTY